jgi:aldehyde:ferredoxin oxidoreductase
MSPMRIVRVDMENLKIASEEASPEYEILGNRGLVAKILLKEVAPTGHPLGGANKLILAGGPLAGTGVPTSGRLSAGGISPLTGGIKESNSGGIFAGKLVQCGVKALVIENKPRETGPYLIVIGQDQVEILRAEELSRLGNYEVHRRLLEKYGQDCAVVSIGPAGEDKCLSAGIFGSDMGGLPGAVCARGGLGALMGAKGLKAVVVLGNGSYRIPIIHREKFKEALARLHKAIAETPQTAEVFPKYGTAAALMVLNELGGLPTRNFKDGRFEKASQISAQALYQTISQRGGEGKTTYRCMPGCTIQCYNKYPDPGGRLLVSPLQYETLAMLGSNLGIGDLDQIARLNYLCNDVGVDTVELGAAVGMAMDAGQLPFDGAEAVAEVIRGIPAGHGLSRILASGAEITGKVFGIDRVLAAKGQGLPAHEPRAVKGMGVVFSTSAMGADHTTGVTFREPVDHHKPEGQVSAALRVQIKNGALDALGLCYFVGTAMGANPRLIIDLVEAVYGRELGERFLIDLGKAVLKDERIFNEKAGFGPGQDRIPDFFRTEKLPPFDLVFDVPQDAINGFWEELEKV